MLGLSRSGGPPGRTHPLEVLRLQVHLLTPDNMAVLIVRARIRCISLVGTALIIIGEVKYTPPRCADAAPHSGRSIFRGTGHIGGQPGVQQHIRLIGEDNASLGCALLKLCIMNIQHTPLATAIVMENRDIQGSLTAGDVNRRWRGSRFTADEQQNVLKRESSPGPCWRHLHRRVENNTSTGQSVHNTVCLRAVDAGLN